ncbi:MAG TPA: hypothetical protein VLA78_15280, partial [Paracoccaceae bacterium]|nr:hypothetical protein [Paracoccaceae bacterium]
AEVPPDGPAAAAWLERAAEQGHAASQSALGMMYGTGKVVARDLAKANFWNEKADESQMTEGAVTACTPASAARLENCRRVSPRLP